jgi:hypothetical protein
MTNKPNSPFRSEIARMPVPVGYGQRLFRNRLQLEKPVMDRPRQRLRQHPVRALGANVVVTWPAVTRPSAGYGTRNGGRSSISTSCFRHKHARCLASWCCDPR